MKTVAHLAHSLLVKAHIIAHSVALTWVISTSPGVTTQQVYRYAGPCPTATFTLIAAVGPTVSTYTDNGVTKLPYCYEVVAVAPTGTAASNQAEAAR